MSSRTHAELWEGKTDAEWERIKEQIRANRLTELAQMGVDVADPAALEAAYDDHYLMVRLAGREMRKAMALSGTDRPTKRAGGVAEAMDIAERLHAARMKVGLGPRHGRESLL
jgi:hypothetical protein